jgi:DNA-binding transcriptional LysR family regulator
MELRHLRYLLAVADERHFGRAADRLNMSQPPLSRQIRELEDEIGFPIFRRGYHAVELTEAGRVYVPEVRRILQALDTAARDGADVAAGRSGRLRVGHGTYLPGGYLSRVLAGFQQAAPGVAIDLVEGPSSRILPALQDKSIDVAFLGAPSDSAGLVHKKLWRDALVIAVPEDSPYVSPLADLALLAHENFVLCPRSDEALCRELIESIFGNAGFVPRVLQTVESKQTALDLVAAGIGVSVVQSLAAAERSHGIRYLAFPGRAPHVDVALAWRDDAATPVLERFVDAAAREAAAFTPLIPMDAPVQAAALATLAD